MKREYVTVHASRWGALSGESLSLRRKLPAGAYGPKVRIRPILLIKSV